MAISISSFPPFTPSGPTAYKMTSTFSIPDSPVSASPSLSKSSHTKLPIDNGTKRPKSTDKLVVESVSESVMGSSPRLN